MSRRAVVLFIAAGAGLLAGCSVHDGEADWGRVTALTCASTIARAGLPAPTPAQLDPRRFIEERRRLLAGGTRFNTVTPFKNVCNRIRKELAATTTTLTASPGQGDTDPLAEVDNTEESP